MAELSTDVRIFLSSTFVDLQELREEIARRLRDVFGAHLLVMESFGSDAAPPVISAIRRRSGERSFHRNLRSSVWGR